MFVIVFSLYHWLLSQKDVSNQFLAHFFLCVVSSLFLSTLPVCESFLVEELCLLYTVWLQYTDLLRAQVLNRVYCRYLLNNEYAISIVLETSYC